MAKLRALRPFVLLGSPLARRLAWPAAVVVVATLPVGRAFSLSSVFYLRDLAGYFWPHHLWLRRTIWSGLLPFWAPEAGLGYATIADPNLQLLFPLTVAGRLLLPDVLGFNLMVALPAPLAALGAFLFLRRHFAGPAAAAGALVFAVSGPFLSTLNAPNLSSSVALLPWVLWALERYVERPALGSGAGLGIAFALEALAGEPLTLLGVGAISLGYAALVSREARPGAPSRLRLTMSVAGWGIVGALLSAVQLVPLVDAASRSPRVTGALLDGWSLHPLTLLEAVVPVVFGGPADAVSAWSPWLFPLNGGREPFLGSVYMGVVALAVALVGMLEHPARRWIAFWGVVLLVGLVLALGYFTPVYPWLRSTVPLLGSFRYPAKFLVFAAFALGCLAAAGSAVLLDARHEPARGRRLLPICLLALVAGAAFVGLVLVVASPGLLAPTVESLAGRAGLADPRDGAAYLLRSLTATVPRVILTAAGGALLLWIVGLGGRPARSARALLVAAMVLDPLAANESLNPTVPAAWVGPPRWVEAVRSREDRVYSGLTALLSKADAELPATIGVDPRTPAPAVTALVSTALSTFPMAWDLRGALTPDLTRLRPAAYSALIERFAASDREARRRFLSRIGTRYHLALGPPAEGWARRAPVDGLAPMALYEDPRPGARVLIVPAYRVVPDPLMRVVALLDRASSPSAEVLLGGPPPPPAGVPAPPGLASTAAIIEEWPTGMRVTVSVPEEGGFLVVRDAYDAHWVVDVDGTRAPLLEADGLFRAVRLIGGQHDVLFRYRPRPLLIGALVSLATGVTLILGVGLRRRAFETAGDEATLRPGARPGREIDPAARP
jgi:hypothetical protein